MHFLLEFCGAGSCSKRVAGPGVSRSGGGGEIIAGVTARIGAGAPCPVGPEPGTRRRSSIMTDQGVVQYLIVRLPVPMKPAPGHVLSFDFD